MMNYFFDLIDGGRHYVDSEGALLEDDECALREARSILGDALRDGIATSFDTNTESDILILVRTSDIPHVVGIRMTLTIEAKPALAS